MKMNKKIEQISSISLKRPVKNIYDIECVFWRLLFDR